MSNSPLASVTIISHNKTSRRNHAIDSVAIHTMAGNLSAKACGEWFQNPSCKASSNYGIGSDGTIGLYVDESDRSWCTSNAGVDNRAVTIEVASITSSAPFAVTDQAYDSLINLLVDICTRNGISGLKWRDDKSYAVAASNGGPVTDQNIFLHKWFSNKDCPGQYLHSHMADIASQVTARLTGVSSPISASSTGIARESIKYEYFDPYVVTIERNSRPQYSTFKDADVFAGLVEAGYLYNRNHQVVNKFDNQNLENQIAELDKINLPYGLFMYGRAKNSLEAKDEMYYFSFPLRRHPPKLGAWIQLDFDHGKEINNLILDRYKQDLVRLGFATKMGIICTRSMLEKIDWKTYQEDFFLWLIDHVSDMSEVETLLDPQFFDTDGEG